MPAFSKKHECLGSQKPLRNGHWFDLNPEPAEKSVEHCAADLIAVP